MSAGRQISGVVDGLQARGTQPAPQRKLEEVVRERRSSHLVQLDVPQLRGASKRAKTQRGSAAVVRQKLLRQSAPAPPGQR